MITVFEDHSAATKSSLILWADRTTFPRMPECFSSNHGAVTATGRLCVESAGYPQPCHGREDLRQETCIIDSYDPRSSPPSCSREFSMHCWRVSSAPWRRRRPNCPSVRTIWRECVRPDSGRGESSGNFDKRTKLLPVTGWDVVRVEY